MRRVLTTLVATTAFVVAGSTTASAATCDRNATTSTFGTELNAATTGETICLASGDYGLFQGTSKAVTIAAASGASPEMTFNFNSGDGGFTLDGLHELSGVMYGSASDITIRNSEFTDGITLDSASLSGIVLDHNTHNWAVGPTYGSYAKIDVNTSGTLADPAVTIEHSEILNGDLHGIRLSGSGVIVRDNELGHLCDFNQSSNGTTFIRLEGGSETLIDNNFLHEENASGELCDEVSDVGATQGIASYDGGTEGVIITNNVVDLRRPWGIELYSDDASVIEHNTLPWHADADCAFTNLECGQIYLGHKTNEPCGSGTLVRENVTTEVALDCSTATEDGNLSGETVTYAGGPTPASFEGFRLAMGGAGRFAASRGRDVGVDFSRHVGACDYNATTSTWGDALNAASPGETICLATGDYGLWQGTDKAVKITAAPGAEPEMEFNFNSGDGGFTLDGVLFYGGVMYGTTSDVTISNSEFTAPVQIDSSALSSIMFDHNRHNWDTNGPTFPGSNGKFMLTTSGTLAAPAVTIENSQLLNGDLDGIHSGGSGVVIRGNEIGHLCDYGLTNPDSNHTDAIQFEGGSETLVDGNYVHEADADGTLCDETYVVGATQGITSFDGGTHGLVITDNVVDIHRPWGIELYNDDSSIVRHNTVPWYPDVDCAFPNHLCGKIDFGSKNSPCGSGSIARDNVTTEVTYYCSTGTDDHNVSGEDVTYVGGASPTTYPGFALAAGSDGENAASDGKDVGIELVD